MAKRQEAYRLEAIPRARRWALDAGYLGRRRHIVHGLVEVDVTGARRILRQHRAATGERLSFTAFVIHCLGKALTEHPHVHAYRNWRNQLVLYDDVNVNIMIEVDKGGRKVPMPYIIEAANLKTYRHLHDEIRAAQARPADTGGSRFMDWFLFLPAPLRRLFYWVVMRVPQWFRAYSSPVLVTAVGMFGRRGGWAITMPNFTLTVAVGGIVEKPGLAAGRIEAREYLDLTVSVDHDVVDGGPAWRFGARFVELLEDGYGLGDLVSGEAGGAEEGGGSRSM
jgi:pyruvate/2-oxoglutarate dehydrogenase complex dihydrolipoamide acyltransferase (E2) component